MSSFIYENDNFISFRDFLLSESIRPKKIQYGTNNQFDDLNILSVGNNLVTSFSLLNKVYTIIISNGEVGFHFTKKENINLDSFDYLSSIENDSFLHLGVSNASKIFSYVFFIVKEMIIKYDLKIIIFNGKHDKLESVYNNLVKNKHFIEEFNSLGFIYTFDKKHIFKR